MSKKTITEQIDEEFERKVGAIEDALLLRRAEKTFFSNRSNRNIYFGDIFS